MLLLLTLTHPCRTVSQPWQREDGWNSTFFLFDLLQMETLWGTGSPSSYTGWSNLQKVACWGVWDNGGLARSPAKTRRLICWCWKGSVSFLDAFCATTVWEDFLNGQKAIHPNMAQTLLHGQRLASLRLSCRGGVHCKFSLPAALTNSTGIGANHSQTFSDDGHRLIHLHRCSQGRTRSAPLAGWWWKYWSGMPWGKRGSSWEWQISWETHKHKRDSGKQCQDS